jgi:hypothetical protein
VASASVGWLGGGVQEGGRGAHCRGRWREAMASAGGDSGIDRGCRGRGSGGAAPHRRQGRGVESQGRGADRWWQQRQISGRPQRSRSQGVRLGIGFG